MLKKEYLWDNILHYKKYNTFKPRITCIINTPSFRWRDLFLTIPTDKSSVISRSLHSDLDKMISSDTISPLVMDDLPYNNNYKITFPLDVPPFAEGIFLFFQDTFIQFLTVFIWFIETLCCHSISPVEINNLHYCEVDIFC